MMMLQVGYHMQFFWVAGRCNDRCHSSAFKIEISHERSCKDKCETLEQKSRSELTSERDVTAHASQRDQEGIGTLAEEGIRVRDHWIPSVTCSSDVHHTAKADNNRVPASLHYEKKYINNEYANEKVDHRYVLRG